jgi:hypothetical protein
MSKTLSSTQLKKMFELPKEEAGGEAEIEPDTKLKER